MSDELRLGHEAAGREAVCTENVEHRIVLADKCVGDDARDGGSDHEPVAAESGRHVEPIGDGSEDGLMVGRDVVDAGNEQRIGHMRELGEQRLTGVADRRTPALAAGLRVAARAQVAGEHAAVGELLRREAALRSDDEGLEQALADRLAEEEVPILADDR